MSGFATAICSLLPSLVWEVLAVSFLVLLFPITRKIRVWVSRIVYPKEQVPENKSVIRSCNTIKQPVGNYYTSGIRYSSRHTRNHKRGRSKKTVHFTNRVDINNSAATSSSTPSTTSASFLSDDCLRSDDDYLHPNSSNNSYTLSKPDTTDGSTQSEYNNTSAESTRESNNYSGWKYERGFYHNHYSNLQFPSICILAKSKKNFHDFINENRRKILGNVFRPLTPLKPEKTKSHSNNNNTLKSKKVPVVNSQHSNKSLHNKTHTDFVKHNDKQLWTHDEIEHIPFGELFGYIPGFNYFYEKTGIKDILQEILEERKAELARADSYYCKDYWVSPPPEIENSNFSAIPPEYKTTVKVKKVEKSDNTKEKNNNNTPKKPKPKASTAPTTISAESSHSNKSPSTPYQRKLVSHIDQTLDYCISVADKKPMLFGYISTGLKFFKQKVHHPHDKDTPDQNCLKKRNEPTDSSVSLLNEEMVETLLKETSSTTITTPKTSVISTTTTTSSSTKTPSSSTTTTPSSTTTTTNLTEYTSVSMQLQPNLKAPLVIDTELEQSTTEQSDCNKKDKVKSSLTKNMILDIALGPTRKVLDVGISVVDIGSPVIIGANRIKTGLTYVKSFVETSGRL